ncbi:hypothetical protein [Spirosoma sp.]|uniref:hypothetical protein n=1 Tax=Spirosoma sp. TaxID=1899569 RepID=UPI003B3A7584
MEPEKEVNHSEEEQEGPSSGSVMEEADAESRHSPTPSPIAAIVDKPSNAPGGLKLINRGSKLRKQLLKKKVPIAYKDQFKDDAPAIAPFLSAILEQKVDRFANLMEKFIHRK